MSMLDTNLLIDWIMVDEEDQSPELLSLLNSGEELVIAEQVFVELEYVLATAYLLPRNRVAATLRSLIQQVWAQVNNELLQPTIDYYEQHSKPSFVDCMLIHMALISNQAPLYTRDKKLANQSGGLAQLVP